MKKVSHTLIYGLSLLTYLLSLHASPASAGLLDLKFGPKGISADLRQVTLSAILEKISMEKNFWYSAGSTLLENEVSLQFEDLSFEKALKRILAKTNYSLVSDENGNPIGAIVLSPKTSLPAAKFERLPELSMAFMKDDQLQNINNEDEPQNIDRDLVIIDSAQMEMLSQLALASSTNDNVAIPVFPGIPEKLAKEMSIPLR
jgi:hypothetical protein